MKIKSSLVLIAGISLASTSFLKAATITNLKANGSFEISNDNTPNPIMLSIGGDTGTTKIGKYSILSSYLNITGECDFNGVRVGRGNGTLPNNTAIGFAVLDGYPATGDFVTGVGSYALQYNSSGSQNTAIGYAALQLNNAGNSNTASGVGVLRNNTTGSNNTASGVNALVYNVIGSNNTAIGQGAMLDNTAGSSNTSVGVQALLRNKSDSNTGIGMNALVFNNSGSGNVAIGTNAATRQRDGSTELAVTSGSIYIGAECRGMSNADYNSIVIGAGAWGEGANTTVIGNGATISTHLYGKTISDSLQVNGNTVLSGTVVLAQAQGDISMGAYQ